MSYFFGILMGLAISCGIVLWFVNDTCDNLNTVSWSDEYILVCYPVAEVK